MKIALLNVKTSIQKLSKIFYCNLIYKLIIFSFFHIKIDIQGQ